MVKHCLKQSKLFPLIFIHLGKKKSKFKSIKKFFGKKKRKEMLSSSGSDSLKPCQSASDVTASGSMHTGYDSEDDLE